MRGIAKGRALAVMFIMLGALLAGTSLLPSTRAAVLFVGGAGPGNHTTIQGAIDAANPGDTVYVYSGTYHESLEIRKTMSLIGEDRDTTVVGRSSPGDVIQVSADRVNISGFTVMNSGHDIMDAGIRLESANDCRLSGNNLSESYFGIYVYESHRTTIVDNVFWNDTSYGVRFFWSDDNIFVNNASPEVRWPPTVWIFGSTRNLISNNHFLDYFLWGANNNIITNNTAGSISVWFTSGTAISGNLITRGVYAYGGLYLDNSSDNTIRGNTISDTGEYMSFTLYNSRDNLIYHNNIEVLTQGSNDWMHINFSHNTWDNGYPSGGNYWKTYAGEDKFSGPDQDQPGSDGFGDEPHTILIIGPGWNTSRDQDRYPLMEPYVVPPAPPSSPLDLRARAEFRRIELEWRPPRYDGGSPITNYSIYRGYAPGTETFLAEIGNVTMYVDTGLEMGKTYYYQVAARNAVGEGPRSNEVRATVPVSWKPPLDLIRVPGFENNTVNWTPPGGGGGSRICSSTFHEDCVREAGNVSSRRSSTKRAGG